MAQTNLNPEAPIFIPVHNSHLSIHPFSNNNHPLSSMSPSYNPIFYFSTAPTTTYPFFLFNSFYRSPLFFAVPPLKAAEKEAAVLYFGGGNGGGGGVCYEEKMKMKSKKGYYRMKPRNCENVRNNFGRKKMSKNEKVKTVLRVSEDGNCTTVMVRNIPSKYTREKLMEFLDRHCKKENENLENRSSDDEKGKDEAVSAFDFLYLPIDFNTGMNKGYAFVNFTLPAAALRFIEATDDQTWDLFNSSKIRQIARARLQGKENLVKHFENMGFPCETDEVLPIWFDPARDGSGKLVKESTVGRSLGRRKSG